MKAFCYGVWIQFLMDLRSRSLFITCYLVPLLFFYHLLFKFMEQLSKKHIWLTLCLFIMDS